MAVAELGEVVVDTAYQRTYEEERTPEQVEQDSEVKKRVLRGMELLYKKHGEDWVEHIDLQTLRIASITHCILGQVFGGFSIGMFDLNLADGLGPRSYGFAGQADEYAELDAAWKEEIAKLQNT